MALAAWRYPLGMELNPCPYYQRRRLSALLAVVNLMDAPPPPWQRHRIVRRKSKCPVWMRFVHANARQPLTSWQRRPNAIQRERFQSRHVQKNVKAQPQVALITRVPLHGRPKHVMGTLCHNSHSRVGSAQRISYTAVPIGQEAIAVYDHLGVWCFLRALL